MTDDLGGNVLLALFGIGVLVGLWPHTDWSMTWGESWPWLAGGLVFGLMLWVRSRTHRN